jgi:hypothetical protein
VKSSWFSAALQIPSFLREFELATILQCLQNFHRRHPYEVGLKEIAQNKLWMRKKLMIKDAHPMCIHTMCRQKANLDFACYICMLVCIFLLFFGDGAGCGSGCNLRIGTVHLFFLQISKDLTKVDKELEKNCQSLKPSKLTII